MKKILVTGGCGFIGYNLTKRLIEEGHVVDVIDNLSIGKEAKDVTETGACFLGGDIRAMMNIPNKNYDFIFHLAALSRIQPSFVSPHIYFSVNCDGTRQVLEYALENNCKLIYAGSSSKHHNPELSPYAMSKHIAEEWIKMYKKNFSLNAEIVRFYNVYGPGELVYSHMSAVIGLWRSQVKKNEPITIVGDGEQKRDFTHIEDIIDGLMMIAFSNEKHQDGWELGSGKNYSINEIYEIFKERFGVDKEYVPNQLGNYKETIRLNDDTLNRLGWKPKKDIREYILNLN
jgi:UDP-glucose 4-epimerase